MKASNDDCTIKSFVQVDPLIYIQGHINCHIKYQAVVLKVILILQDRLTKL
jgi:hypothetical protein